MWKDPHGSQMTKSEFETIRRKIDLAFNNLHDDETIVLWYDNLKEFSADDVEKAVADYIYNNNRRPTVADIVQGSRMSKVRRTRPIDVHNTKTVKCPYCNDTGLIVTEHPGGKHHPGAIVGTPCTHCEAGRIKHPWEFKTEDEKEKILQEEERQGLKPPRDVHVAPKEFYEWYCFGTEMA